jgi:CRP/FNR family transcriptional regulator, cyclic AMP receptor protein
MNLLSGTPCTATVRVRDHARLLALDGGHFTRMVTRYPSLQLYLFRMLAHRLRETNMLMKGRASKGINGSLDDLHCAELLQALHTSQKSGSLELSLPQGKAQVVLVNGEIVDVDYLRMKGPDAFFTLLRENEGTFSFTPAVPPEYAKCRPIGDFMHLLMEGFVRLDESLRESIDR